MPPVRLFLVLTALFFAATASAVALPPGATTAEATDVTSSSATLNGVVDPHKKDTTWYFEYGTTTAYGARTPDAVDGGNAGKAANASVTGLAPATVYHFRLVATNADGTVQGTDKTFTTPGSPYALPGQNTVTITAVPAKVTFGRATVISGNVTGPNNANVQVQLQENPYPYTGGFKDTGTPVATDATGKWTFSVKPGLHTRYQVVAKTAPPTTSPAVQVLVRYRVGFRVSDSSISRGQRVRFRGTVAPAHDGRVVRIQRRTSKGFKTVARATLRKSSVAGRSTYSKRIRVYRKGTYRVRVGADADHSTGTSRRRTIRIVFPQGAE